MTIENKLFETELLIQVSDINYGGHLGNDRFLTLAQEVRVRWLRSLGWTEKNIANSGAGFIVTEAQIQFLAEAFLGQTLIGSLFLHESSQCSCVLHCVLADKESQQKVGVIATKVAFFDYNTRKIASCPKSFPQLLEVQAYE